MNALIGLLVGIILGFCIGRRNEKSKRLEALDNNALYVANHYNITKASFIQ